MAFWQRRSNNRIFVYTFRDGKQVALPRSQTKHLDAQPEHNIEHWIHEYERREGKVRERTDHPLDAKLVTAVEQYCEYFATRKKSPKTVDDHRRMLLDHVLVFFTIVHKQGDPNQWPPFAPKLAAYIREHTGSEHQILRANSALRGFWQWLGDEQYVVSNVDLRLRKPVLSAAATPLQRVVKPEEVLAYAQAHKADEFGLMALLGYFFSLRPQETFGLRPSDFAVGKTAADLECCKVMARFHQFSKMAVHVQRQRVQSGKYEPPKAGSEGWVACFNETAARLLVDRLKALPQTEYIFGFRNDRHFKKWKTKGIPGITLKDFRRASLYHLGHHVGFDFASMKSHARHAKPETTMLYLRRPDEQVREEQAWDLDA